MVLLTTFCTDCLPSAVLLPVTKFVTFETSQWVRNVDCDWNPHIADFYVLRDRGLFECDYESIGVFLPPELSFTVMFVMFDTACDFNSDNISCVSQSMSSLHVMTALQELSDLCRVTVTRRSIMDFNLFIWRFSVAEETSRRKSPLRSFLIYFNVPIVHLIDLSMTNGDSL